MLVFRAWLTAPCFRGSFARDCGCDGAHAVAW